MTIDEALGFGRRALEPTDTAAVLSARLLLQHVLRVNHPFLVAHNHDRLTAGQWETYQGLVGRAGRREPIPYLTGTAAFLGRDFDVSPAVLIPRPETEQLVEVAVAWAASRAGRLRLADVGTGSGCIAVSLALLLPAAEVEASDLYAAALEVARRNAARHGQADRIRFYQGSLLEPLAPGLDAVVANLPYVSDAEWPDLDEGIRAYEPELALRGGPDGLAPMRQLLEQARRKLAPAGALFLETGWQQGEAVQRLAKTCFPRHEIDLLRDFAGHERIVAVRPAAAGGGR
ncbi:MAG: peptide chain release factor N(5)-glutamine methyltransferase [Candidatus Promineifilaceae bacterium]